VKKAAAKSKTESTSKARAPVGKAAKTSVAKPAAKSPPTKSAGKARG
jgi:DNA topoisomerase-1